MLEAGKCIFTSTRLDVGKICQFIVTEGCECIYIHIDLTNSKNVFNLIFTTKVLSDGIFTTIIKAIWVWICDINLIVPFYLKN